MRESRSRRRRGGGVPLPRKFYEFFISKWCDMVQMKMTATCGIQKFRCMEGKKIKHLSKYWGSSTQDDPCRSNSGGCDPCNPCGVDAYAYRHTYKLRYRRNVPNSIGQRLFSPTVRPIAQTHKPTAVSGSQFLKRSVYLQNSTKGPPSV